MKFKKGDLVYRTDSHYYGIVVDFDVDEDIYIRDMSGDGSRLLDWAKKYKLLTQEDIKNGKFFKNR